VKQTTTAINRGTKSTPRRLLFIRVFSGVLFSRLSNSFKLGLAVMAVLFAIITPVLYTRIDQPVATAAPNNTVNFQARLLTNTGALVPDGNYHVEFKIYSQASGGTLHWTETRTTGNLVAVKNGYISVALGSVNALSNASPAIDWGDDNFLSMNIGGSAGAASWNGEMSPRMLITSVPYALRSAEATTLKAFNGANSTTLSATAPTANRSILLPDADGTVCLQSSASCGFLSGTTGIQLQGSTPGTAQTGNFNITGTGIVGVLQASTSVQTSLLDTASAGVLSIGTTNATQINLNQNTIVAAGKNLSLAAGAGNVDFSASTGTFASGTGTVTLNGNTNVSAGKTLTVTSGLTSLTSNATTGDALNVSNSTSTGNIAVFSDNVTPVLTIGDSGTILFKGIGNSANAFRVQRTGGDPIFGIDTSLNRIKVGNDSAGSGADSTIFVLDSATTANQPTGVNGGSFYDTTLNKFRCYENGAYKDCDTGITSVGAVSGTSTANGASITGTTLNLAVADGTNAGLLSTVAQTIAGAKTFTGINTFSSAGTALQVTNNATVGGTLGVTGLTTATGGLSTGASSLLTVGGATLNNTLAITDKDYTGSGNTGSIGTAGATVDIYTSFTINQTTAGQTLTIPAPTTTTTGRLIYITNIGSAGYTIGGSVASTGTTMAFVWNNTTSAWTLVSSGTSGNYIQNGTAIQTANFNVQSNAIGSVTATIQGANSQTANIIEVKAAGVGTPLFSVGANGATALQNSTNSTTAFRIQNNAGTSLFTVDTTNTAIAVDATMNLNGNTTIGNATTDRLTVTSQLLGQDALVFQGATDNGFTSTFRFTDPTANNIITFPDASGTVQLAPASGSYLLQVPSSSAVNTVTPTAAGVTGLTVNGTSNVTTAGTALVVNQANAVTAVDGANINLTNTTGTLTNGLLVNRNGAGGTTTNLLNLTNTAGTATNALTFTGTFTKLINSTNFNVTNAGALTAVGVDSGTGLLQGTGGLTVTGATSINASGATATNIGTGTNTGLVTIGNASNAANTVTIAAGATNGINLNAPKIESNATTLGLFTTPTTVNAFTAATTIAQGASAGTTTFGNGGAYTLRSTTGQLTVQSGSGTLSFGSTTALTATGALGITSGGANALTLDTGGAATLSVGVTNANAVSISRTGITTTVNGNLTVAETVNLNGNTTLGNATTDRLTVTSQLLGQDALVFQGATDNGFTSTFRFTDPTANNIITFPDASGTVQLAPASGSYLLQVPSSSAVNTVTPTAAGVTGLTVNGTSNVTTAGTALVVNQANAVTAVDGANINLTNTTGTLTNGLLVNRNGAGGTTTNLLNLTNTAGTATNALTFTGTFTKLINSTNFNVTNAGALTAVGVDSGTGLLQGTGGLTVTGATSINASGATATNIGTGTNTGLVTIGNASNAANTVTIAAGATNGINLNAPKIESNATTLGLFTTPTTVNAFTAATTIAQGASAGTTTFGNGGAYTLRSTTGQLTVQSGSGTLSFGSTTALTATGALGITSGGANALTLDTGGAATLSVGVTNANAVSISRTGITTTVNGNLTVAETVNLNGNTTIGNATTDRLTVTGQILGQDALVFQGATDDAFTTTLRVTNPTANNILTLPNETGTICTTGSVCTGYAPSATNGYVQLAPATVQADATTNSSIFINKTGASGNILQLQGTGSDILLIGNTGATTFKNTTNSIAAFQVQNAASNNVFKINTANRTIGVNYDNTLSTDPALTVANTTGANDVLWLKAASSQTGDLIRATNFSGQDVFRVYPDGSLLITNQGADSESAMRVVDISSFTNFNINNLTGFVTINGTKDASGNLLQDGSFEGGTTYTWGANEVTSGNGIYNDAANARTGNKYLRISGNGSNMDTISQQFFTVNPGETIYFEGYVKSVSGNGNAGIYLEFTDKDKLNPTWSNAYATVPGASYELRSITATVPAGKTYARPIITKRNNATVGTYYFDDMYLKATTEKAPFNFKNTINSTSAFQVQNAGGDSLFKVDTTNGAVMIGDDPGFTGAKARLYFGDYGVGTIWIGEQSTTDTDILQLQGKSGIYLTVTGAPTNVMTLNDTGQATFQNVSNSTSAFKVINAAGTSNVLTVDTTNNRLAINSTTATADLSFGTGGDRSINVITQTAANTAGNNLTVVAATGNGTGAGGTLTLQGGTGGAANANGGNLILSGGLPGGTGTKGLVVIDTPTYSTASAQNCATNCTITQANVNNNGVVLVNSTAAGLSVTLPDPTNLTAGRVVYVTAGLGSNDFTLVVNGGGTGNEIAMRANTTATMIWNGTDWTAAGASSSTTLQAAYDNTLTSAGGAELVLAAAGGAADGLTVRNNGTTPIVGGLLEVQTSIGSNLFSVNNNATEYATNGGAESSTFTGWAASTGGTVTKYVTPGVNIATGQASVSVATTALNHGAKDTLNTTLTPNLQYSVSFAAKAATANFSTLDVYFSRDGTTTAMTTCKTGATVTTSVYTRVSCTFTAPATGITAANGIIIRQSDGTARTFYLDNLSVNVNASSNFAVDGSVDDVGNFATYWTAAPGGGTVTRDTTNPYDTSASAKVVTTATAGHGIRNNMAINPSINTQYLVSFYAQSSNTFNDILVRYSRDGGTNFVSCADYNIQSVGVAPAWTKITCLFTTDGTAPSNADLVITQTAGTARSIWIDALTVTLNTNNASNVQIGGANEGGPATLFTLDRASSAPIAANNDAYLGSMYYDTSSGRIQCYEADGWGACGAAPDNIVNLNPEYAGAVLNGTGVGTMTTDFCSNDAQLSINSGLCSAGQAKNFYKWTSPQATQQTYSIYVTYQLPATFKGFSDDNTVQLTGLVDNTTNASVTYEMFKSDGGDVTTCGTETNVITGGGGAANTWYSYGINGNESTGCSFTTSSAGNFVIFKINMKANSGANAYVSTLSFTTTGR
jgi:hypothetical protein